MYSKQIQSKPKKNQFKYSNRESSNKAWIIFNFFLLKPKKLGLKTLAREKVGSTAGQTLDFITDP